MAPLQTRKLEQKLVAEGLMDSTSGSSAMAPEGEITMATVGGVERLRASCDLTPPEANGNHDDHIFWEGWRDDEELSEDPGSVTMGTSPPVRSQTSVPEKPYPPTKRNKTKKIGF